MRVPRVTESSSNCRQRRKEGEASLFSFLLSLSLSVCSCSLWKKRSGQYRNTKFYEVPLKTPGGFVFNGARRGSAPAVWFINAAPTAELPIPLTQPAAAAADRCDGLDGSRELFVAQTILSSGDERQHADSFSSFPNSLPSSSLPSPSFHS